MSLRFSARPKPLHARPKPRYSRIPPFSIALVAALLDVPYRSAGEEFGLPGREGVRA